MRAAFTYSSSCGNQISAAPSAKFTQAIKERFTVLKWIFVEFLVSSLNFGIGFKL